MSIASGATRRRIRRLLLRAVARLPIPAPAASTAPPARLLIIRPDAVGDVLLATPALARLRQALPATHITVAAGPWATPVLEHAADTFDDLWLIPFPGFTRTPKRSPIAPYTLLMREARRLHRARFDAVLILRPDHWWGAMLGWAAGIPRRLGYAVPEVAPFCTEVLPLPGRLHTVVLNLGLVDALTSKVGPVNPQDAPLVFSITPTEQAEAGNVLTALTGADGPLVALHPGAGAPIKQWSTERWQAVAATLVGADGARIVLTGGPAEAALTRPIAAALPPDRVLDLTGRTPLGALAAVFARCDLVLGVDSGALHLATATAPRTLRLYGPSDHLMFGPWGDPARHRLVRAGLRCHLCHNLDRTVVCPPDCMGAISVEQVVRASQALLQGVAAT